MKGLILLVVALAALAIAVPIAQTAPTSATGCAAEHVSGAECQGPDVNPAAEACEINTWVDNATCELTVPDGVASRGSGGAVAYSEQQGENWFAEFDYEIRDASTGQVLFSAANSETTPIAEDPTVPAVGFGFDQTFSQQGGTEVVCEVTGTHNPAGAAMSAAVATTGIHGQFNNTFLCAVE